MSKDFNDFKTNFIDSDKLTKRIETTLKSYADENGSIKTPQLIEGLTLANIGMILNILEQYHEWISSNAL